MTIELLLSLMDPSASPANDPSSLSDGDANKSIVVERPAGDNRYQISASDAPNSIIEDARCVSHSVRDTEGRPEVLGCDRKAVAH
jgi:hypothetical protein